MLASLQPGHSKLDSLQTLNALLLQQSDVFMFNMYVGSFDLHGCSSLQDFACIGAAQVVFLSAQVASGVAGYRCKQQSAPLECLHIGELRALSRSEMHVCGCSHIFVNSIM